MRVLIVTDAFPPICGGSGWSTYELARGLRAAGHAVLVVRPRVFTSGRVVRSGPRQADEGYDGFTPVEFHAWAPPVPFVRNYFKNERLYEHLASFLADRIRSERIDVVHAQHLMSGPASIGAAHAAGVPVVCTIRDYWPVCYWSDLIHDRHASELCPRCSAVGMTSCIRQHAGAAWPVALAAIPYMQRNLALKRRQLSEADAVIAVSGAIARDLRARAPELARVRMPVIHNAVDVDRLRKEAAGAAPPLAGPYAVYVGKLEPNKGIAHLLPAVRRAGVPWPLVIVGDGSGRQALEDAARREGRDARFMGWRSRAEVLGWMRHASVLVFPSHGPESLSRVLIEASALGVPIAAMETGGTGDVIIHEETGLLSHSAEELADHIARLVSDRSLAERLGLGAQRHVEERFAPRVVIAQIERLYRELMGQPEADDAP